MLDDRGDRDRAMRGDVLGDVLQLRKGIARHRLGEDVDDSATGQTNGERVVVADAVALQLRSPLATTSLAVS